MLHTSPVDLEVAYKQLIRDLTKAVQATGLSSVVLGISGGLDSALVATLAVDALGREQVHGVFLPSPFTTEESGEDAMALAQRLGIGMETVPIAPLMGSLQQGLSPFLTSVSSPTFAGLTWQNIQARIRGLVLMAFANEYSMLLLSTGNRSELAVGYCTLYGDMAGGIAPLGALYKTEVIALAEFCNRLAGHERIPARIISKEPSAELAPEQRDSDSLPAYAVLDPILLAYVDANCDVAALLAAGFSQEIVARVVSLVRSARFKWPQAAPCIAAFGRASLR